MSGHDVRELDSAAVHMPYTATNLAYCEWSSGPLRPTRTMIGLKRREPASEVRRRSDASLMARHVARLRGAVGNRIGPRH